MIRRLCLILLILFGAFRVPAQYVVQLVFKTLPAYTRSTDSIFAAGSFNQWNPSDAHYKAVSKEGIRSITMKLSKGSYLYKITRGSWDRAEADAQGRPSSNRELNVSGDTTIEVTVDNWTEPSHEEKRSTASRNVHIVDTAFYIPQLDRRRRVWIYLPSSYHSSTRRYPVLYMHDGQNLFDEKTSAYGEWGVDEALDSLKDGKEIIVVGIDHGGKTRLNEYSPFDLDSLGSGEGDAYARFLAETLKPFIDKHYRTRKERKYTAVAGSSMGGLISLHTILKFPKTFGAAGVFSPAFWTSRNWENLDPSMLKKVKGRIYFYGGGLEGESMVPKMLQVLEQFKQHSKAQIETVIRSQGKHDEATWRAEFPVFLNWLLSDIPG